MKKALPTTRASGGEHDVDRLRYEAASGFSGGRFHAYFWQLACWCEDRECRQRSCCRRSESRRRTLDTRYQAAVKTNDANTMDRVLADDFVLVAGLGKTYSKADLLAGKAQWARTHRSSRARSRQSAFGRYCGYHRQVAGEG